MTPTFAATAIPSAQAPTISPAAASDLITMSVHHQSSGKFTPLRQSGTRLSGGIDTATSAGRAAARITGSHQWFGRSSMKSIQSPLGCVVNDTIDRKVSSDSDASGVPLAAQAKIAPRYDM